jgi:hypothetical protein
VTEREFAQILWNRQRYVWIYIRILYIHACVCVCVALFHINRAIYINLNTYRAIFFVYIALICIHTCICIGLYMYIYVYVCIHTYICIGHGVGSFDDGWCIGDGWCSACTRHPATNSQKSPV